MTKELFVSATPHETRVGMVEDDQLAEIYLERENEYTLAGSIYKGRVTRVLPGMQSAFVDIGLERDAFLYVSDFMELEDSDEMEAMPSPAQAVAAPYQPSSPDDVAEVSSVRGESSEGVAQTEEQQPGSEPMEGHENGAPSDQRDRGDRGGNFRGRRRRRGRRAERGIPESKFARPGAESQPPERPARADFDRQDRYSRSDRGERSDRSERNERSERSERNERSERSERNDRSERGERSGSRAERGDYGPPPGYQPIILPGESISKYRNAPPSPLPRSERAPSAAAGAASAREPEPPVSLADSFPADEPFFAESPSLREPQTRSERRAEDPEGSGVEETSPWDNERQTQHQMNVAAVFGEASSQTSEGSADSDEDSDEESDEENDEAAGPAAFSGGELEDSGDPQTIAASAGTMEEEEIEEEEADLASYVEDLEEDAAFEELEEETHAAGDARELAASGGSETEATVADPLSAEPIAGAEGADLTNGEEEVDEAAEEEAEIEDAQAEAEALLDAEGREAGTVDARAEVRAPAPTAAYTQRAPRQGFDRQRGYRGRRGGGGGPRRFRRRENQNMPLISDLLKEGQEILVQIAKEPIGKKGARITSHIALPGRFLVYMPTVNHTGVSRKISSDEERQRLKRIILSERENGHGGFIVRTAAQNASEEELRADIRFLKGLWNEIKGRAESGKSPALIYHDLNVVERVLRDQVTSDFSAIWVDNEQEYERILRFANRFQPALVKRVKLYTKETPLFDQFGLNEEINKALKSKVWLKSGGYIVINQTEALVAIDVNTGKYVGKTQRLEDTIVKTNVDAIREIVRQVRLRDLGGIIVIDFIDMDERRNRQRVMQALEEALRGDRAPSKVLQFNDFGLVAITRKRVKQSLERTIGSPCPYCQATGFVKSVGTVCNEIYIEMRKISKHLEHTDVMLRVNPEVAKALKSNNGRFLNEMEELTKKTVIVKSDPSLHQEQFDIN